MEAIIIAVYFLPSGIALMRNAKKTGAIFFLNLFTGWTLIGWVASGCWALADEVQAKAGGE